MLCLGSDIDWIRSGQVGRMISATVADNHSDADSRNLFLAMQANSVPVIGSRRNVHNMTAQLGIPRSMMAAMHASNSVGASLPENLRFDPHQVTCSCMFDLWQKSGCLNKTLLIHGLCD